MHLFNVTHLLTYCLLAYYSSFWFIIHTILSLQTVQRPAKTAYLNTCLKCPSQAFTKARSFLTQYGLVDGVLWQIIPHCLQDFLQLVDSI